MRRNRLFDQLFSMKSPLNVSQTCHNVHPDGVIPSSPAILSSCHPQHLTLQPSRATRSLNSQSLPIDPTQNPIKLTRSRRPCNHTRLRLWIRQICELQRRRSFSCCFQRLSHYAPHRQNERCTGTVAAPSKGRMRTRKTGDGPKRTPSSRVLSPPPFRAPHPCAPRGPAVAATAHALPTASTE
jgi:hypothetical protein